MNVANALFAFDKQSARSFDADGRMRVRDCVISVAEVNPYYGKEIPNRAALGLDDKSVYDLYRDPDELAAAAESFNGLPLMIRHVAQSASDPRKHDQIGSVYNARYDADRRQLRADLLVSDANGIDLIESGHLSDLSSSYRYTPEMVPGEVDGRKFHGRMRGIQGNHVALVEDGRATGAHVADSALSSQPGANTVDPTETPNNGNAAVAEALQLLASRLESIETRLTAVEGGKTQTPQSEAENGLPANVNTESVAVTDDESTVSEKDEKDEKDKPAMDAATVKSLVAAAVKAERDRASAVETAKRATRADLGDMIAMDSAEEIYGAALKQRGVDISSMPATAYQAAYQAIQAVAPGTHARGATHAHDSRTGEKPAFNTTRIRNLGR